MCSVLNVASGNQACTMLHKKHTVNIAIYEIMCAATSKSSDWIKSFFHSDVFYLLKKRLLCGSAIENSHSLVTFKTRGQMFSM